MPETEQCAGGSENSSSLLHRGRWGNADVYLLETSGGRFVLKTFRDRPAVIRWTIGRFLTRREYRALRRLEGIEGVPGEAERPDSYSVRYRFVEGETLGRLYKQRFRLPRRFFLEAEALLQRIHERGLVHLDLRRGDNWLLKKDGAPAIIDFQSALDVRFWPAFLRKGLQAIDRSGLYKLWERLCEVPLDAERKARLERVNRVRRLWFLEGYAFSAKKRKKRKRRTA